MKERNDNIRKQQDQLTKLDLPLAEKGKEASNYRTRADLIAKQVENNHYLKSLPNLNS